MTAVPYLSSELIKLINY